jgi:hypothetical protein
MTEPDRPSLPLDGLEAVVFDTDGPRGAGPLAGPDDPAAPLRLTVPRPGCTRGPPYPDKAGRSADALGVGMAEAQEGGSRPSRHRGGDQP